jgi:hypothetical protein
MAKGKENNNKIQFGKRKRGSAKKSFNKHTPREKAYRGQGR